MTPEQLRQALKDLRGDRTTRFMFESCGEMLCVSNAFLVPVEADNLVKLTDGKKEYVIDAQRITWIEIG
ncbi:MAG: hypothetical protein KJZ69_18445 [Phycisphaerales bacterium]|nr:hypothetical protein [Phycisphaerales bacterium]